MGLESEAVRAPELRGQVWFNTERPLTLANLRGKLVLLDFWTYACINCLHVLEDLKYLERKFAGQPLVVVGVHSPKFDHEDDPESVRQAILRYGITHPVLLDSGRKVWDAYAVRGWPTLVLVDPRGYILGRVSGEGNRERLASAIEKALDLLRQADALSDAPLPLRLEAESSALDTPLLFPGKILVDGQTSALFVADTGHHRIICSTLDGSAYEEIGSGEPGQADGDYLTAQFHSPQGMALDAEAQALYVADTGNHVIRRVDLRSQRITTVAGTGAQSLRRAAPGMMGAARETALNSPWDLCLLDGKLYIAMAGPHQIWIYDPASETVGVLAGSGAEGRADGPPAQAAFAQPSGIATDGARVFVADSEISCVRAIDLNSGQPQTRTLAGGDLFQFGDRDGRGDLARLQHPLGVTWVPASEPGGGFIYVADTYNHKIRRLDPTTRDLTRFAGAGKAGSENGTAQEARFAEPGGLSYARGALYIADTNNHAVRVISLPDGQVSTLRIVGLCAPGLCLPG